MKCNNWEDIKNLLENIIDSGQFKYGKYMKCIDVKKKRKRTKTVNDEATPENNDDYEK